MPNKIIILFGDDEVKQNAIKKTENETYCR